MAKKEKQSISERLEAIQEAIEALDKDKKDSVPSLPPSVLQREVEKVAPKVGLDQGRTWGLAKDIGRAVIPKHELEALARYKLRGETYKAAKDKAEEARENLEERRPGLFAVGQTAVWAGGTAATLWMYSKLSGGGTAQPNTPAPTGAPIKGAQIVKATAAPVQAASRSRVALQAAGKGMKAGGRFGPILAVGMAVASLAGRAAPTGGRTITRFYKSGPKAGMTETVRLK